MTSTFTIRPMRQEDLRAVSEIDALCFEEPWPEHSFAYELTTSYSICLVAEIAGGVVAAALVVWVIVDEAHIATIAVHPAYRQQRLGICLLAEGLMRAAERGAQMSMLEVRASNEAAISLYKQFGYESVGIRKNYYQNNNEDAILLNLEKIDLKQLRNLTASKCV